jgi:hypothetical protein
MKCFAQSPRAAALNSQKPARQAAYPCSRQQITRGRILLGLARASGRTPATMQFISRKAENWHTATFGAQPSAFRPRSARAAIKRRSLVAALDTPSRPESSRNSVMSYLPSIEPDRLDAGVTLAPRQLPRAVEGPADNPSLANPLERQNRLGTGWMGVILEYEGVVCPLFYSFSQLPLCTTFLLHCLSDLTLYD